MQRILYLLALILVASCTKSTPGQPEPVTEPDEPMENIKIESAKSIQLQSQTRLILEQSNSFAFDFFMAVSELSEENLFLSPFSMFVALGMLYNGAAGDTKEEIATVLGINEYPSEEVNNSYKELTTSLLEVDPYSSLSLANAIWVNKYVILKNSFVALNQNYFDAETGSLDFGQPSLALKTINDWCNEKTKGTIPAILEKIDPLTTAIFTNAICFNSFWTHIFDKTKTTEALFYYRDGTSSQIPMMHQKQLMLKYAQMSNCGMVVLPYANTAFALNLILPDEDVDIDDLLENFNTTSWQAIVNNLSNNTKVTLSMPRFVVQNTLENIQDVLAVLGMPTAFSVYKADFSAMIDQDAYISKVIQKSYISVDEEGTKAAAVSVIEQSGTIGPSLPPPEEVTMIINRPFLFLITEQSTGVILFMGKVVRL